MLEGLPLEVVTLDDFPDFPVPVEDQDTFEANARLKALHYAGLSGCLTLADDSGLLVDALGVGKDTANKAFQPYWISNPLS